MSDNTSNNPITSGATDPKPGVAEGHGGTFVRVEGCEPLPRNDKGGIDWKAAGFEVVAHEEDGSVSSVIQKGTTLPGALFLRVDSLEKAVKYLGEGRLLAGLNANGMKVKGQDTNRAYLTWLKEQKAPAWNEDGTLKETYRDEMLRRIWSRYAGIALEKRQGAPKVVTVTVEVRVVVLPNGEEWKAEKGAEDPVADLRSAWLDAMMQEDEDADPADLLAKVESMETKGRFHKMLGLPLPQAE